MYNKIPIHTLRTFAAIGHPLPRASHPAVQRVNTTNNATLDAILLELFLCCCPHWSQGFVSLAFICYWRFDARLLFNRRQAAIGL